MEEKRIFVYRFMDYVETSTEQVVTINYQHAPSALPSSMVQKTIYVVPDGRVFACFDDVYRYNIKVSSWLDYLINLVIYDDELDKNLSAITPKEMNVLLSMWNSSLILQGSPSSEIFKRIREEPSSLTTINDILTVVQKENERCSGMKITSINIRIG